MNEVQNLLTIDMAAKYLHCHPETVRRMIRRGELKAVKFRKFWRVPMEGLQRAGNADSVAPASTPDAANPLAKALAMVEARDKANLAPKLRKAGMNDAASELRQMREEQTP